MKSVSSRRAAAVLAADIAASAITAMALTRSHPLPAFEVTLGINALAYLVLPGPGAAGAARLAARMIPRRAKRAFRATVSAIVREPEGPRPAEGTRKARRREWRERLYFGLSRAEWDSRIQIGMSLWHTERLAYHLPNPGQWDEWEERTWPHGEWVGEIEAYWRETGRGPQ